MGTRSFVPSVRVNSYVSQHAFWRDIWPCCTPKRDGLPLWVHVITGHRLSYSFEHTESRAVMCTLSLEADLLLSLRSVQTYFCRLGISSDKDVGEISIVGSEATPFIPPVGGGEKRQALSFLDIPVASVEEYCCFCNPACEMQETILNKNYMFQKLFKNMIGYLRMRHGKLQCRPHVLHSPN